MRRRYLVIASVSAAAVFALRSHGDSSTPAASSATVRDGRVGAVRAGGAGEALVPRAHYRLAYEQRVTVPGQEPTIVHVEGEWIATPRRDGRTEVQLSPTTLDGPGKELPIAMELDAAAQLVTERGALVAIGFPERMPVRARKLLTGLATTFQYTAGAGASWAAAEEDLTGRYDATYRRSGAQGGDDTRVEQIERGRARFTALRTEEGLSARSAEGATPAERTRFRVDADGVVGAAVELDVSFALGPGLEPVRMALRASLERESIELVPAPVGEVLAAAPISGFADFEGARRNADRSAVAGATLDELLVEAKRAAGIAGRDGGQPRAQALARLAALIRLEPEAAEEIAAQIHNAPEDLAEVRVLAGALASSRVAAGTDALARLLERGAGGAAGEPGAELPLPADARGAIVGALSLASPVTSASLRALSAGLDQPHGDQAALGLGTHGRKAREQDPAAANAAVELLLARHAGARDPGARRLYLESLGNAGSEKALPVLRAAMQGGDRSLAMAATFSLRFVPGADTDALLEQAMTRPATALSAIRAAGYRDPARFRALLYTAQEQYAGNDAIQGEIRAILRRWG
jgi:hypothetical protein